MKPSPGETSSELATVGARVVGTLDDEVVVDELVLGEEMVTGAELVVSRAEVGSSEEHEVTRSSAVRERGSMPLVRTRESAEMMRLSKCDLATILQVWPSTIMPRTRR